jgi:UDP-glucose 4-epimerase
MKEPDKFYVETISVRGEAWKSFDFSKFDVVFHVAGIAHVSPKKSMKNLYFKVNRDLAIEVAKKAKDSFVKQFILMSSMIVYSSKETLITINTIPNPDNFYGRSKFDAENNIKLLESKSFLISIIRAPLIYGLYSRGNLNTLFRFIKLIFIFPEISNKRSIIHIFNFSNIVKFLIENELNGLFFPQNSEYFSLTNVVKLYAKSNKKIILFTKVFNPFIFFLKQHLNIFRKIFNDYYYDKSLSKSLSNLNVIGTEESLKFLFDKVKF